jgi:hypothetical protein
MGNPASKMQEGAHGNGIIACVTESYQIKFPQSGNNVQGSANQSDHTTQACPFCLSYMLKLQCGCDYQPQTTVKQPGCMRGKTWTPLAT